MKTKVILLGILLTVVSSGCFGDDSPYEEWKVYPGAKVRAIETSPGHTKLVISGVREGEAQDLKIPTSGIFLGVANIFERDPVDTLYVGADQEGVIRRAEIR